MISIIYLFHSSGEFLSPDHEPRCAKKWVFGMWSGIFATHIESCNSFLSVQIDWSRLFLIHRASLT